MPLYPPFVDLYSRYQIGTPDYGIQAASFAPVMAQGAFTFPTAGRVEFVKIRLPASASITNIVTMVVTAGGTLTAGQCFMALYTSAGALLGQTADQAAAWASTGIKIMAIAGGAQALPAGFYYVAGWFNGTTGPSPARATATATALTNYGLSTPNLVSGNADTAITTTAPATLGTQTGSSNYWWAALT